MTPKEAQKLQPGQRVFYHDWPATVRCVRRNGVTVEYWGRGLQEDRLVSHRASSNFLRLR